MIKLLKYFAISLFISHSLQDKSSVGTPAILTHKQQSTHVQETLFNVPNQPQTITDLPPQEILVGKKKKMLTFQTSWFKRFPWLHVSDTNNVLCFHCSKADKLSLLSLTAQNEGTFINTGFINWKKQLNDLKNMKSLHATLMLYANFNS